MTALYVHQGPMPHDGPPAMINPLAARLHWSHSITYERDFLSEWQAIERAGDLAADLGFSAELRIDSIVLPCATSSMSTRFHFIPWCTYFLDWTMTSTFLRFKFTMILWLDGKTNLGIFDLRMMKMIPSP